MGVKNEQRAAKQEQLDSANSVMSISKIVPSDLQASIRFFYAQSFQN